MMELRPSNATDDTKPTEPYLLAFYESVGVGGGDRGQGSTVCYFLNMVDIHSSHTNRQIVHTNKPYATLLTVYYHLLSVMPMVVILV